MMVSAIAILLTGALFVMFAFSREALMHEAMHDAAHTLEETSLHIDNILLSVEQTTGNFYYDMMRHMDDPERMEDYCRELVMSNRYIVGCAIALKPYYYPARETFMAYVRRKVKGGNWMVENYDTLETLDSFLGQPYTIQEWYTLPMETSRACWIEPVKDGRPDDALITFSLPIYDFRGKGFRDREKLRPVGVLGVDVPLARLSDFILRAKPSENGYSVLLGKEGQFIVHPDTAKLNSVTVLAEASEYETEPSMKDAAQAMVTGGTGFAAYMKNGQKWYVVYKPFVRSEAPGRTMEDLGWSVGIAYPDSDIFREYNRLLYLLAAIALIGLLTFFVACRLFTRQQLQPLTLLTESARRIADGHYDETVPDTRREDEIGQLQVRFQKMVQALAMQIGRQEQLSRQLSQRGQELRKAYSQAKEADRMKTSFLHYMTNQMVAPSDTIDKSVTTLCSHFGDISPTEAARQVDIISQNSEEMLRVLDHMLQMAEQESGEKERKSKESGKEGAHE